MVQPLMSAELSLERLAAGLLIVGFPSTSVSFETAELIAAGVRNFILFARNTGTPAQVRALTRQLQSLTDGRAIIAIDHEGGRVNRLREAATSWPSPMAWAATDDLALARNASGVAARELSSLGINLNFAPVADVLGDCRNPVLGTRCFSDDAAVAAAFTAACIDGYHDASVGTAAKHFPGHGATPVDSHLDLPTVERSLDGLRKCDLAPFAAAIQSGTDCLMLSHVWYSALDPQPTPATMSRAVVALARDEMSYDGVIVTDCLEMGAIQTRMTTGEAVLRAILAGSDLVMVSHSIDRQWEALHALVDATSRGDLPRGRLIEANRRSERLRRRLLGEPTPVTHDGESMAREIARSATTLVRDRDGFLPLRLGEAEVLGVVTFGSTKAEGIEGSVPRGPMAEAAAANYAKLIEVRADGSVGTAASVVDQLQPAETVLVGTAFAIAHARQAGVVCALLEAGKKVIVVATHDPFDLLAFPQAPCYLASYGDTKPSIDAALDVVFGRHQPRGKLPVVLPGLYPRGHGLTTAGIAGR